MTKGHIFRHNQLSDLLPCVEDHQIIFLSESCNNPTKRRRRHGPLSIRYGHTHPKDHLDDPYGEYIEKAHVDSSPYDTVLRCPCQPKILQMQKKS